MWLPKIHSTGLLARLLPYEWSSFPFFIKVCFIVSMLALLGILLAFADIYLWRTLRRKKERRRAQLSDRINQQLLPLVLPAGNDGSKNIGAPLAGLDLSRQHIRRALVHEMINYRNYFSGEIASRICKLYLSLGLDKEAKQLLHHKRWENRVYAMMELFKMDVCPDTELLYRFTEDKHSYVRDYAWLLLIKCTKEDPLDILRQIKKPISQWETFEIFFLFQQRQGYRLGSMKGLISEEQSPSIVSLALKLVVYFKDVTSARMILELLHSENIALRIEAVAALGKLGLKTSGDYLIHAYQQQPYEVQLEILTALGEIKNTNHIAFLEHEFLNTEDFDKKKHASDALIRMYPLSQSTIDKLLMRDTSDDVTQRILHHSLNPLINAV